MVPEGAAPPTDRSPTPSELPARKRRRKSTQTARPAMGQTATMLRKKGTVVADSDLRTEISNCPLEEPPILSHRSSRSSVAQDVEESVPVFRRRGTSSGALLTPQHRHLPSFRGRSRTKSEPVRPAVPPTTVDPDAIIRRWEGTVRHIQSHIADKTGPPPPLPPDEQVALVSVFDEMLARFNVGKYHKRYGMHRDDRHLFKIQLAEPLPSYFANVPYQSIYFRKVVSMQGLRNLILFGPTIFAELKEELFSSDPYCYPCDTGLHKMKMLTGNTVDLDTVVLRCNEPCTVQAINAMNAAHGLPGYASPAEFANSPQAVEIAIAAARPLLDGFAADFQLSPAQCRRRHVDSDRLQPNDVPVVHDNGSRGRWPVWRYQVRGVDSFHCNVPTLPDVVGALLLAPMYAARAFLRCRDDPDRLDQFYEDGISESCFNWKWKALEEFTQQIDREGSISNVLAELQAAHQHIFTPAFFEQDTADNRGEVAEMTRLAQGRQARDASGTWRPITPADVAAWVRNPAAEL